MITYTAPRTFCYCVLEDLAERGYKLRREINPLGGVRVYCADVNSGWDSTLEESLITFCKKYAEKFKLKFQLCPEEHKGASASAPRSMPNVETGHGVPTPEGKFNWNSHGPKEETSKDGPFPDGFFGPGNTYHGGGFHGSVDFEHPGGLEYLLRKMMKAKQGTI